MQLQIRSNCILGGIYRFRNIWLKSKLKCVGMQVPLLLSSELGEPQFVFQLCIFGVPERRPFIGRHDAKVRLTISLDVY